MDSSHYYNVSRMARSADDMKTVDYMLNLLYPGQNHPVDDPWYHDMEAFEQTYRQLDAACEKLVNLIRSSKKDRL